MFFAGARNILVPGDIVFMLFKYMCNNISIEEKRTTKIFRMCPFSIRSIAIMVLRTVKQSFGKISEFIAVTCNSIYPQYF